MGDAPCMSWVGMHPAAATSPQALVECHAFYSHTPRHEVVESQPGCLRGNGEAPEERAPRGATPTRPSEPRPWLAWGPSPPAYARPL